MSRRACVPSSPSVALWNRPQLLACDLSNREVVANCEEREKEREREREREREGEKERDGRERERERERKRWEGWEGWEQEEVETSSTYG